MKARFLKTLVIISIFVFPVFLYSQEKPRIDRSKLSVSLKNVKFEADGGKKIITVSTGNAWKVSQPDNDWCHVNKKDGRVVVLADANDGNSDRKCKFTITSGTQRVVVSVSQLGFSSLSKTDVVINEDVFIVSDTSVSFDSDGGTIRIEVTANREWDIIVPHAWWIQSYRDDNILALRAEANTTRMLRTDYMILGMGKKRCKITFSQIAQNYLEVSESSLSFGPDEEQNEILVSCNHEWGMDLQSTTWARFSRNGNKIIAHVDANPNDYPRNGNITIRSGNLSCQVEYSQAAKERYLSVLPQNIFFECSGGIKKLSVSCSGQWTIDNGTSSWYKINRLIDGVSVVVSENVTSVKRRDSFVIKYEDKICTVLVSQEGRNTSLIVSNTDLSFSHKGGRVGIRVWCNYPWEVAVPPASWGRLDRTEDSLYLIVEANRKRDGRSDYFKLRSGDKEARINVSQSGKNQPWLFQREELFASHFMNLQCGYNNNADAVYAGGSYTFMSRHLGLRILGLREIGITEGNSKTGQQLVSLCPVVRLTEGDSRIDFHLFAGPAAIERDLGWELGFRMAWKSKKKLSLWDLSASSIFTNNELIPIVGLGLGIPYYPAIGLSTLLRSSNDNKKQPFLPHYFFDVSASIPKSTDNPVYGAIFDWIPSRVGTHTSCYFYDNGVTATLGMAFRLTSSKSLIDLQMYGGVGYTMEQKEVMGDIGMRLNLEDYCNFSWFDIAAGVQIFRGGSTPVFVPTISIGLGLVGLSTAIRMVDYYYKN